MSPRSFRPVAVFGALGLVCIAAPVFAHLPADRPLPGIAPQSVAADGAGGFVIKLTYNGVTPCAATEMVRLGASIRFDRKLVEGPVREVALPPSR